jgi:hypothetical protein
VQCGQSRATALVAGSTKSCGGLCSLDSRFCDSNGASPAASSPALSTAVKLSIDDRLICTRGKFQIRSLRPATLQHRLLDGESALRKIVVVQCVGCNRTFVHFPAGRPVENWPRLDIWKVGAMLLDKEAPGGSSGVTGRATPPHREPILKSRQLKFR